MLSFTKTIFKTLAIGAIALPLLCGPAPAAASSNNCLARVVATRLHLRARPDPSAPSIQMLHRNDRLRVTDDAKAWWAVTYKGHKGFVDGRYVARISEKSVTAPLAFGSPASQLRQVENRLKQRQGEAEAYTRQESRFMDSLDKINATLNDIEKKTNVLAHQVAALTTQISENKTQAADLQQEVAHLQAYAASRLVAVYKLDSLGTLPILASADSIFDFMIRKRDLKRLLTYDATVWHRLSAEKAQLATLETTLSAQREALRPQVTALGKQREALTGHRDERERLLERIKRKKSLALVAIHALETASEALNRQVTSAASQSGGMQGDSDFSALKGLLNMPVKGKIISFYGPYTSSRLHVTGFRCGIDIAADRGEPIKAVDRGKTIYAGWFRGYGNMVIIDHGDHYCTLYAHAQEIFKKKGEPVASGDVIATVGATDSLRGPELHFEIRHYGKPVDPLAWIGKRSRNDYDQTARH